MRSRTSGSVAIALVLMAAGCVSSSTYDEQVLRADRLEKEVAERDARIDALEHEIQSLEKTEEMLALERDTLDTEKIRLLEEIENLREGNADLAVELSQERKVREERERELATLSGTYSRLVEDLEQELHSGQIEIQQLRGQLQVRAMEGILFDSGSTQIRPQGRETLAKIAAQIGSVPGHVIRVEGHTDPKPISTDRFPSNWELSTARAAGVVRFFVERGIDPTRLSAVGYGPYQPIATNDTPEGRSRNRRIEIVLVPEGEG